MSQLNHRGQHRAEDFAGRRQVVAGDPATQFDQARRQRRNGVEHLDDFLDLLDLRLSVSEPERYADQRAIAKRNHDTAASHDNFSERIGYCVGKSCAQGDRERDFAEARNHWRGVVYQLRRNDRQTPRP